MGLLLDIEKKWFLQFPGKLASFKRQFLREAVVDSNTNLMHSLPAYDMAMAMPQGPHHSIHHVNAEVLWDGVSEWASKWASKWASELKKFTVCVVSVNLPVFCAVAATGKECIRFVFESTTASLRNCLLKEANFPGNCKNHFFPMSKSSPIVCTIYGHVSSAAILYTKPEGPYFHHVKYHRDWSSHSRVEICA